MIRVRFKHLLLLLMLLPFTLLAQDDDGDWQQLLAEIMTAEDSEEGGWEETCERLSELAANPIDLNCATRDQLAELPFLSEQQVEDLLSYLYHYGPMKSLSELRMVASLGVDQLRLLPYFVTVVVTDVNRASSTLPSLAELSRYGRHELMASARVPFNERRGDRDGYLGYPYRHWLRYTYTLDNRVKAGLVAAQDAGEPLFAGKNAMGYDYYSLYLQLRGVGRLENLVVGRLKLQMGMGLIAGSGFALGKLATLQQLGRQTAVLRPHSSRSPTGYFQGIAATVSLSRGSSLTAMGSYRALDATLANDGTATTLLTTGYHRTPTEMDKKNNTHATDGALSLKMNRGPFRVGVNMIATHLNRRLQPSTTQLYRRYYPQGTDFLNASIDYGYASHRLCLSGETAIDRNGALATLNSLSLRLGSTLSLMLMQRFYSYRYTALYARSLSEGTRVQNESALYAGVDWRPSPSLRLQAYTDNSYAPWPRYGISQSSHASDNMVQMTVSRQQWRLTARYRLHLRQQDDKTTNSLNDQLSQRARLALTYDIPESQLSFTTQADGTLNSINGETGYDRGLALSLQAAWSGGRPGCLFRGHDGGLGGSQRGWLRLNASAVWFHTDNYDSRIYIYERSPLYSFSFPSLYGHGLRYTLMARADVTRRLMLTLKFGVTDYFDRTTTGTGLQQTYGSSLTDLDFQVRWKL